MATETKPTIEDEEGGTATATATPPSVASDAGQTSEPAPASSAGAEPVAGTTATAPADEVSYLMDEAKKLGLDLSQHGDDETAFKYLVSTVQGAAQLQERLRQLEGLMPFAQTYAQHGQRFQEWLAQQGQAQPAKKGWWNPPEYNPTWEQLLEKDPTTGEIKLRPGAPPDILPKYLAYQQHRREFADRLMSDPGATLKPLIEEEARRIASEIVQQNQGQLTEQMQIQQFEREHANWLYAKDANGRPLMNGIGQQVMTPEGERFVAYTRQATQLGINNVQGRIAYARDMLSRDLAMAQVSQAGAAANGADKKAAFLQQAAATRKPNTGGSVQPPNLNGNNMPQNDQMPLRDRLRNALKAEGVTDEQLGVPVA